MPPLFSESGRHITERKREEEEVVEVVEEEERLREEWMGGKRGLWLKD